MTIFLESLAASSARPALRQFTHKRDVIATVPPDAMLRHALALCVRSTAEETKDLGIELPRSGVVRMRNLVHRGAQRPVMKVPSLKLGRTVQCESLLEADAALLLDASPSVTAYAEQPIRIHYWYDGVWRSHIPDFALLLGDQLTLIELKFSVDVDEAVWDRTRLMAASFARFGVGYQLLTEADIRQEPMLQNARRLLRRARHEVSETEVLGALEYLRRAGRLTLDDFGWTEPDCRKAIGIARLILTGHAAIEPEVLLTGACGVWSTETSCHKERAA